MELGLENKRIWVEPTVADARTGRLSIIRNKIDGPRTEMIVLFMSRIVKEKGVLTAIQTVESCQSNKTDRDIPLRLWIAGEGQDLDEVRHYVDSRHLQFVELLGDIRGERKWDALEDAHVFLFPTCYPEGLSNVVLEAMIHGLPIVTRSEGALGEVIRHELNGFITSSTDPSVFADYLRRLARDQSLYRRIALNNLREGAQFSRDVVATRLIRIYREIGR